MAMKSSSPSREPVSRNAGLSRKFRPVLAALGLVPVADPLPELSGWRRGAARGQAQR